MSTKNKDTDFPSDDVRKIADNILEHGKRADGGNHRSITKALYTTLAEDISGIPAAQLKAVDNFTTNVYQGAILAASEDLVVDIAAAKKAGNDPADLRAQVTVPTGTGRIQATVRAESTTRIPQTGEQRITNGSIRVVHRLGGAIQKASAAHASDIIAKAMKSK